MPRFLDTQEEIRISTNVARWLMDTTVSLLKHYLGRDFDPAIGTFTERDMRVECLQDSVPMEDHQLRYWINTVINLCTTIAGILHNSITAGELMRLQDMSPLTDSPDENDYI